MMNGKFEIADFGNPVEVIALLLIFFAVIFARYVLVSAIFFAVFYKIWPKKFQDRKITAGEWRSGQFRKEVGYSALTSAIFALSGALMVWAWQEGHTAIYTAIGDYGYPYFFLSIVMALFVHETYYYWAHRWMHRPAVFRAVHKVHHESLISSPWTAFSFHPWESILQAIVVPVLVWLLPMHPYAILTMLVVMTVSAVINHLDIEIYPAGFDRHWIGRWLIGATHHSLHHQEFKSNYGLYFTFWDKWMGTESRNFEKTFSEKTRSKT